jgi:hypothetical protein
MSTGDINRFHPLVNAEKIYRLAIFFTKKIIIYEDSKFGNGETES